MHYEQQQVGNTVVKLSTRPEAFNAEPIREPFERALKTKGKSTSAKGRVVGEDVKLAKASGKEENEHTPEWWEGYDPGMDASFLRSWRRHLPLHEPSFRELRMPEVDLLRFRGRVAEDRRAEEGSGAYPRRDPGRRHQSRPLQDDCRLGR